MIGPRSHPRKSDGGDGLKWRQKAAAVGSRMAGRLANDWYAVYVETPGEEPDGSNPPITPHCKNIRFAEGCKPRS